MRSNAATVDLYLADLPAERREMVETVRQLVMDNLPAGYEETMNWGMITYQVPLETYPDTYNKKPLMYAALASQKNYVSLYLIGIYADDGARQEFEAAYRATGKRYDVGKSCVRFRTLDDLPLPLIAKSVAAFSVEDFLNIVEKSTAARKKS